MEYKSPVRLLGLPLVHFATGRLEAGKYRRGIARGWVAIGDIAFGGLFAVGGIAVGTIGVGGLALGGIAVAGLSIGIAAEPGRPSDWSQRAGPPSAGPQPWAAWR